MNMKLFKSRKFGKIQISLEVYENFWLFPGLNIIPTKIEFNVVTDSFHIECFCELFRELEGHEAIPSYLPECSTFNGKPYITKIEEVK